MQLLAHLSSVTFKHDDFTMAVPSCSLGNSEEAHMKTWCISSNASMCCMLKTLRPVAGISMIKTKHKSNNQTKSETNRLFIFP